MPFGKTVGRVEVGNSFELFAELGATGGFQGWADQDYVDDAAGDRSGKELRGGPSVTDGLGGESEGFGEFTAAGRGCFVVDDPEKVGVSEDCVDSAGPGDVEGANRQWVVVKRTWSFDV